MYTDILVSNCFTFAARPIQLKHCKMAMRIEKQREVKNFLKKTEKLTSTKKIEPFVS